jgi:uncharacterized protein (TIGR01777 family)
METEWGVFMRVIITGATGLIGRALTTYLLDCGYEVIALSRGTRKAEYELDSRAQVVGWDAKTAEGWWPLVDGVKAIINLAGENIMGIWTHEKKRRILESRVNAAAAVVSAVELATYPPEVIIQASAIGYYGHPEEPCTEDCPPGDTFLADVCKQWEAAIQPARQAGSRLVIIRTGIVLSTEGGILPPIARAFKLHVGGYIGSGAQWLSWISIDDEIAAIRHLLETPSAEGPYNLTSPQPVRIKEFAEHLGKILHRPTLFSVPASVVRIATEEMAEELLLWGQNIVPKRLPESGYHFKYADIDSALQGLLVGV